MIDRKVKKKKGQDLSFLWSFVHSQERVSCDIAFCLRGDLSESRAAMEEEEGERRN